MAKKEASNTYGKLGRLVIVFIVLLIICAGGWYMMDQSVKVQEAENKTAAAEQNAVLMQEYQQAKAEERALEEASKIVDWPEPETNEGWCVVDLSGYALTNAKEISVSRKDLMLGGMMLVNRWHALPDDFYEVADSDLVSISNTDKSIGVSGASVKLFPEAITALSEMLADAKEYGYENFVIQQGYRTMEDQQKSYDKEAERYNGRYSGEALIAKVTETVSYPGTSEYQSGFAFQIYRWKKDDAEFNNPKFYTTEHSDWLLEHSWEHGFVFRFPLAGYPNATVEDKSFKTGQNLKLCVYRYVGKANAAAMHIMNMCMEEYIEYLMKHPHIALFEDGELRYEITYTVTDYADGAKVSIAGDAKDYSVGMDNLSADNGGVIVCMAY